MDKNRLCDVASRALLDVPKWIQEQISWNNFTNELKTRLNVKKPVLRDRLPPAAFDAIFDAAKKDPSTIYEYQIVAKCVDELESVFDQKSQKALENLVELVPFLYQCLLKLKNGENPQEEWAENVEKMETEIQIMRQGQENEEKTPELTINSLIALFETQLLPFLGEKPANLDDAVKKRFEDIRKNESKSVLPMLASEVARVVQCGSCKQIMGAPKTLPCLHTFCVPCLKKSFAPKSANLGATITCILCRTKFAMDDDLDTKLSAFPVNPAIEAFLSLHSACANARTANARTGPCCSRCATCQPCTLCIQCKALFCKFHKATFFHQTDETAHIVLEFEDILLNPGKLQNMPYQLCVYHSKPFVKFCQTCQISLCTDIMCLKGHEKHELRLVSEICAQKKKNIQDMDRILEEKLQKMADKVHIAEQGELLLSEMQESIEQSINQYFDDILLNLETRRADFLSKLEKVSEECLQQLEMNRENLKNWISKAQRVQTDFKSAISGSDTEKVNINQLQAAKTSYMERIADCAGGATLSTSKILSYPEGTLRTLLQTCINLTPEITGFNQDFGWEMVTKAPGIQSFCVDGQNLFYIRNSVISSQIYCHDLSAKDSDNGRSIAEPSLQGLQSVAVAGRNRIAALQTPSKALDLNNLSMRRTGQLRMYDIKTGLLMHSYPLHLQTTSVRCWLKVTGSRIYVCDGTWVTEYQETPKKTDLGPKDSKDSGELTVVRRYNLNHMVDIADFQPETMLSDLLWVTDRSKHTLLLFNNEQRVVKTVGGEGAVPESFLAPLAIASDSFGHVMVADAGNRRIQFFDNSGNFLKLISYPPSFKNEAVMFQTPSRVVLLTHNSYLYLHDARSDTIFRVRYL